MSNKSSGQDPAARSGTDKRETSDMAPHMQELDSAGEAANDDDTGSSGGGGKAGGNKSKSGEHSSGRSGDSKGTNRS